MGLRAAALQTVCVAGGLFTLSAGVSLQTKQPQPCGGSRFARHVCLQELHMLLFGGLQWSHLAWLVLCIRCGSLRLSSTWDYATNYNKSNSKISRGTRASSGSFGRLPGPPPLQARQPSPSGSRNRARQGRVQKRRLLLLRSPLWPPCGLDWLVYTQRGAHDDL